jgi:periplasmic divalent cation tolerance protein
MRPESCAIVTTTLERPADARRLARDLVEGRLAACVQILPIRSVYRWAGKTQSAGEHLLLAKTRRRRVPALMTFLRRRHPYQVPEVLVVPVSAGLPAYLQWVTESTVPTRPAGRKARA